MVDDVLVVFVVIVVVVVDTLVAVAAAAAAAAAVVGVVVRFLVVMVVNTLNDSNDGDCDVSHCSLREAINSANNRVGPDTIVFDPGVFPANEPAVIELIAKLPTIYDNYLTIDASGTQATIDGSALFGSSIHGIDIQSSGNTIRGLHIQNIPGAGVSIYAQSDIGINTHYNLVDNVTVVNCGWVNPERTGRIDSIMIQADGESATAMYNQIINSTIINGADDGIELVGFGGVVNHNRVIGNTVIMAAENGIEMDSQNAPGTTNFNVLAYNIIEGSNVEDNGGISLTAHDGGVTDNNFLAYNVISNTVEWGIYLGSAHQGSSVSGNTIVGNSITRVLDCGIEIQTTSDGNAAYNRVYLNSVFETDPCQGLDGGSENLWDVDGIGNYWSNYIGVDQNQDGFGDMPFNVGADSFDHFPLMTPP